VVAKILFIEEKRRKGEREKRRRE